jgi:hypothetical protein
LFQRLLYKKNLISVIKEEESTGSITQIYKMKERERTDWVGESTPRKVWGCDAALPSKILNQAVKLRQQRVVLSEINADLSHCSFIPRYY